MGIRNKEERINRIDQWRDQYSKITEPHTDYLYSSTPHHETQQTSKRNSRQGREA